jgi:transglutaminase-like putative cysteine protease
MLLHLLHRTTFVYSGDARDSFNEVRLRPRDDATQSCRQFALRTTPDSEIRDYADFHGNTVHFFDIAAGHDRLVIEAESEVETMPDAARPGVPAVAFDALMASPDREMHAEFAADSRYVPLDPQLWRESLDVLAGGREDVWSDACRLGRHVHDTFAYRPNSTGVTTRAIDALKLRAGVCQDFAHVMLGLCRCASIPARYVSGYFLNPDRRPGEIEASHAWVEAFVPGYGWAPYDPTHDRPADERYVKVGVGRDYADICPVSGTYHGAPTHSLSVEVKVSSLSSLTAVPG